MTSHACAGCLIIVLKQCGHRYTDFLVNEILPDGTVVRLEDETVDGSKKRDSTLSSHETHPKDSSTLLKPESGGTDQHGVSRARNVVDIDGTGAPPKSSALVEPTRPRQSIDQMMHEAAPKLDGPDPMRSDPGSEVGSAPKPSVKHSIEPPQTFSSPKMAKVEPVRLQRETTRLHYTNAGIEVIDNPQEDDGGDKIEPPPRHHVPEPSTISSWQAFAQTKSSPDKIFTTPNETLQGSNSKYPVAPASEVLEATQDTGLLSNLLSSEATHSVQALYQRILASPGRKQRDYGDVDCGVLDRAARTRVHQALREAYASRLESNTNQDGHLVVTAASPYSNNYNGKDGGGQRNRRGGKSGRGGQDHRQDAWQTYHNDRNDPRNAQATGKKMWEELGGDYLHFSLLKENKDTMEVISFLAKSLHTKPASFQFAGTKDRRGVTVQRVSVYRQKAERLRLLNRGLRNAEVGSFSYHPTQLQLGDLSGNEFVITLRDCRFDTGDTYDREGINGAASDLVSLALQSLQEKGFINYYGLQRFGSFETRTDAIGVLMLQGNFKAAVDAILAYSDASLGNRSDDDHSNRVSRDDKARAQAIRGFSQDGKIRPALDLLPRKFSAEAALLQHLGNPRNVGDFFGAIMTIHRNTRLMYVHAYQSLVWNVVASERWKRWGSRVMRGDLVLLKEHEGKTKSTEQSPTYDADGDVVIEAGPADRSTKFEDTITRARVLSEEEADTGKYSVFDIVLPTPGFDIIYPDNEIGEYYKSFMASERGGGLDPYDMRRRWSDMSLTGSYRKLLARPCTGMTAEVKTYSEENEKFVETDLERLQKLRKQNDQSHIEAPNDRKIEEFNDTPERGIGGKDLISTSDVVDVSEANKKSIHALGSGIAEIGESIFYTKKTESPQPKLAIILRMQLQGGQYATMALREFMRGGVKTHKPDFSGGR